MGLNGKWNHVSFPFSPSQCLPKFTQNETNTNSKTWIKALLGILEYNISGKTNLFLAMVEAFFVVLDYKNYSFMIKNGFTILYLRDIFVFMIS